MKRLKIAILVEALNYHSGARAPLEIAKHLRKLGHQVTVYSYDSKLDLKAKQDLIKNAVGVVTLRKNKLPFIGKYFSIFPLLKQLQKDAPHVICFAGTLPFFTAGKLSGIPLLLTYYGSQMDAYLERKTPLEQLTLPDKMLNTLANWYIYSVNFFMIRLAAKVIAISKFSAKEAKKLYNRTPDEVIYLGATSLTTGKVYHKKEKNYIKLLSVSRITPYKGFHLIIDALNNLSSKQKIIFTIAGSQPQKKYLEFLKKIMNKNTTIILNPSDASLSKLYRESDFYINADKYLYFGLPILEAAYFGKPTISLNLAAASELIQHGKTGFIAHDKKELSYYITKLANNKHLRNAFGKNVKARALEYSWERCAKEWENIMRKTINAQ